jgi:branched-chain amino acid transport system permease protein
MILYNIMTVFFTATSRRITTDYGTLDLGAVSLPVDRLLVTALALLLTALLYAVLRISSIGRAIVAVRMDRAAAILMGIRVNRIYAITFGIGALMAGAAGAASALIYPVSTSLSGAFLGKAFVVCVIGGLGSVPGALLGGLMLGLVESFAGYVLGPQHAVTVGFGIMLVVLLTRPAGLFGVKGFD